MLIKKAVSVRKHLERNRKDKDSKFRLILIESRIHRLARYYRLNRKLGIAIFFCFFIFYYYFDFLSTKLEI